MSIGQKIRQLRKHKGLSQGDIEATTGMLHGYISRVERGHTVPSVETLERFAHALDVPLYRLFCESEDEPAASGGRLSLTLERLTCSSGGEASEARFLLHLWSLAGHMAESDRAFLLDCARKLASRAKSGSATLGSDCPARSRV